MDGKPYHLTVDSRAEKILTCLPLGDSQMHHRDCCVTGHYVQFKGLVEARIAVGIAVELSGHRRSGRAVLAGP